MTRSREAVASLAILMWGVCGVSPLSAGVLMQLAEEPDIDTRFQFLGDFNVSGSTPVEAESAGSNGQVTDYAAGRVDYSGVGLHARQTSTNSLDRGFEVHALLRYDELQFASLDGASTVTGNVNLTLDGEHLLETPLPGGTDVGIAVSIEVRSNTSATGGQYSRKIDIFTDLGYQPEVSTSGLLSAYGGGGTFEIDAPLTFSTVNPEKIEVELSILLRTFSANPTNPTVTAEGLYLDTLALDPNEIVTFTSGDDPTFSSLSGEIIDNRLVVQVPEPGLLVTLGAAVVALCAWRRRRQSFSC